MNQESLQVVNMEKRKLFNTIYSSSRLKHPLLVINTDYLCSWEPSRLSEEHHGALRYDIICTATQTGGLEESMDEHTGLQGPAQEDFLLG